MHKKSENAQPVVHADHDHALLRQVRAILPSLGSCARGEASAINPHHHRQLRARRFRRDPHIQRQAVFTAAGIAKVHVAIDSSLHAVRAELRGFAHAHPRCRGHRWFPPQIADWRRGIRDPEKRVDGSIIFTLNHARSSFHLWRRRCRKQRQRGGQHYPHTQRPANARRVHALSLCLT